MVAPLAVGNLVHETSVTTGTGNQTLVTVDGKRTFNTEFGTGGTDVFDYFISNPDAAEWERGTGHMSSSTVLVRDTVIESSNADAAVSFTAGTKFVTNDLPASFHGGVWNLLETVVASASGTIDVINLSAFYHAYKFVWWDISPSANGAVLFMRTDANNGASFDAGTSDYSWASHILVLQGTPQHLISGDNADAEIQFGGTQDDGRHGSGGNEGNDFMITLFNPSAAEFTKATWFSTGTNWNALENHTTGAGIRLSAAAVNAVRFLYDSGNIAGGTLKIYGIRA